MLPFGTLATRCVIRIRENPNLVNYSLYHVSEDDKRYLQHYFTYRTRIIEREYLIIKEYLKENYTSVLGVTSIQLTVELLPKSSIEISVKFSTEFFVELFVDLFVELFIEISVKFSIEFVVEFSTELLDVEPSCVGGRKLKGLAPTRRNVNININKNAT